MDKSKLAEWGERLKTGGAQMSRMVSGKMKEILQSPTVESKMVDEATLETLEEPNWGLSMRICAMINSEEFNGTEVVKAIKKKISGKSAVSQKLSVELLEACAMNCEKVFSEIASEKVLDEMVRLIRNPQADAGNRNRALQLIRAWGESEDLAYLPVFRQTYMGLKAEIAPVRARAGDSTSGHQPLESLLEQPIPPPESYPVPDHEAQSASYSDLAYNFGAMSIEEKREQVVVTRNSLELLSSMLSTEGGPKAKKDDLTMNLLDKCKQSQPLIQMIIESTTDEEGLLFEALNLNDELQRVISSYEELESGSKPPEGPSRNSDSDETKAPEKGNEGKQDRERQVGSPEEEGKEAGSREDESADSTSLLQRVTK